MKRNKLTVVVIAKNEEDKIGECLQSAIWADEIVLIDIRKKIVGQKALFYAVSVAYQLDHTAR